MNVRFFPNRTNYKVVYEVCERRINVVGLIVILMMGQEVGLVASLLFCLYLQNLPLHSHIILLTEKNRQLCACEKAEG